MEAQVQQRQTTEESGRGTLVSLLRKRRERGVEAVFETGGFASVPPPLPRRRHADTDTLGQLVATNCELSQRIIELSRLFAAAEARAARAEAKVEVLDARVSDLETRRDNLTRALMRSLQR